MSGKKPKKKKKGKKRKTKTMWNAVRNGDVETIEKLFKENSENLCKLNKEGESLLHEACRSKQDTAFKVLKTLINAYKTVYNEDSFMNILNKTNLEKCTCLHIAIGANTKFAKQIVRHLLLQGKYILPSLKTKDNIEELTPKETVEEYEHEDLIKIFNEFEEKYFEKPKVTKDSQIKYNDDSNDSSEDEDVSKVNEMRKRIISLEKKVDDLKRDKDNIKEELITKKNELLTHQTTMNKEISQLTTERALLNEKVMTKDKALEVLRKKISKSGNGSDEIGKKSLIKKMEKEFQKKIGKAKKLYVEYFDKWEEEKSNVKTMKKEIEKLQSRKPIAPSSILSEDLEEKLKNQKAALEKEYSKILNGVVKKERERYNLLLEEKESLSKVVKQQKSTIMELTTTVKDLKDKIKNFKEENDNDKDKEIEILREKFRIAFGKLQTKKGELIDFEKALERLKEMEKISKSFQKKNNEKEKEMLEVDGVEKDDLCELFDDGDALVMYNKVTDKYGYVVNSIADEKGWNNCESIGNVRKDMESKVNQIQEDIHMEEIKVNKMRERMKSINGDSNVTIRPTKKSKKDVLLETDEKDIVKTKEKVERIILTNSNKMSKKKSIIKESSKGKNNEQKVKGSVIFRLDEVITKVGKTEENDIVDLSDDSDDDESEDIVMKTIVEENKAQKKKEEEKKKEKLLEKSNSKEKNLIPQSIIFNGDRKIKIEEDHGKKNSKKKITKKNSNFNFDDVKDKKIDDAFDNMDFSGSDDSDDNHEKVSSKKNKKGKLKTPEKIIEDETDDDSDTDDEDEDLENDEKKDQKKKKKKIEFFEDEVKKIEPKNESHDSSSDFSVAKERKRSDPNQSPPVQSFNKYDMSMSDFGNIEPKTKTKTKTYSLEDVIDSNSDDEDD